MKWTWKLLSGIESEQGVRKCNVLTVFKKYSSANPKINTAKNSFENQSQSSKNEFFTLSRGVNSMGSAIKKTCFLWSNTLLSVPV